MKKETMKRLLELAHECQVKGWAGLVEANALVIQAHEGDMGKLAQAERVAREARGNFAAAVSLLDEVVGKKPVSAEIIEAQL
jgi:hypothetical protein